MKEQVAYPLGQHILLNSMQLDPDHHILTDYKKDKKSKCRYKIQIRINFLLQVQRSFKSGAK